jgi:hypothetical protein
MVEHHEVENVSEVEEFTDEELRDEMSQSIGSRSERLGLDLETCSTTIVL